MYVFVLASGRADDYTPHGIRVTTHESIQELIDEVLEVICNETGVQCPDIWSLKELRETLDLKLSDWWSIYSDEHGYLPQWDQNNFRIDVLNPDGLSINPDFFATHQDAEQGLNEFTSRFMRQGFYAAAGGKCIDADDLYACCREQWVEIENQHGTSQIQEESNTDREVLQGSK